MDISRRRNHLCQMLLWNRILPKKNHMQEGQFSLIDLCSDCLVSMSHWRGKIGLPLLELGLEMHHRVKLGSRNCSLSQRCKIDQIVHGREYVEMVEWHLPSRRGSRVRNSLVSTYIRISFLHRKWPKTIGLKSFLFCCSQKLRNKILMEIKTYQIILGWPKHSFKFFHYGKTRTNFLVNLINIE